jgi:hypothetical protein
LLDGQKLEVEQQAGFVAQYVEFGVDGLKLW